MVKRREPNPAALRHFSYGESASYRALTDFSIELRHEPSFLEAIRSLREEWGIEPDGLDLPDELPRIVREPVVWDLGEYGGGVYLGPYPPSVVDPSGEHQAEASRFERQVGELITQFVPLDRFPEQDIEPGPDTSPERLIGLHPLSNFLALCVVYRIMDLPARVGIALPMFWKRQTGPYGGDRLFIPHDTTKTEVVAAIDGVFEDRRADSGEKANRRTTVHEMETIYETWRLATEGMKRSRIAKKLAAAVSTINTRLHKAEELWGFPVPQYRPDEET